MKILVTGMTSRMTSFSRESGFPSLLARSLSLFGHDVTMTVEYGGVDEYDAVFAGISSPLAPASTYLVPTAQTVDEALSQGKLAAVFLDDPDIKKIVHASASALKRTSRLEKPFYSARPGMQAFATESSLRATVLGFIERMSEWGWEMVVWPGHPWAEDRVAGLGSFRSVPVDPTMGMRWVANKRWPDFSAIPGRTDPPGRVWIAESTYFVDHDFDPSVQRQVVDVMTGEEISKTVDMFAVGYGVIQGNEMSPGWWTPFPYLAMLTNRIYFPHPVEGRAMGEPYYLLPHIFEDLEADDYQILTTAQAKQHEEIACPRTQLHSTLSAVLGSPVS